MRWMAIAYEMNGKSLWEWIEWAYENVMAMANEMRMTIAYEMRMAIAYGWMAIAYEMNGNSLWDEWQ